MAWNRSFCSVLRLLAISPTVTLTRFPAATILVTSSHAPTMFWRASDLVRVNDFEFMAYLLTSTKMNLGPRLMILAIRAM